MTFDKVHLGLVATVLNGYAFKSKEYVDEGIRVVRITNVQKGQIYDDNPKFIGIHRRDEFAKFMLSDGDILISLTGNVGRVGVIEKSMLPAVLNQRVGALKPKGNQIDPRFLFYLLNSDKFEQDAINNSKGIAQLNLSSKWIEEYPVPLPPLAEQQRLAAILDKADAIRRKRQAALDQLDSLLQSTFMDMFGDPVTNPKGWESVSQGGSVFGKIRELATIANVIDCKHRTPVYTADGYPVVRPRNVREEGIILEDCIRTSEVEFVDLTEGRKPKHGDIVYSRNATFGVASRVTGNEQFAIGQDVCLIVPTEANSTFLHYLLNSHFVRRQLGLAISGSTFKRINLKAIRKLKILVPPPDLQQRFARIVESIEQQKAAQRGHLKETDDLFHCLVQRAFKGEL